MSTQKFILVLLLISYCIIFSLNSCKPTFRPALYVCLHIERPIYLPVSIYPQRPKDKAYEIHVNICGMR